VVRQLTLAGATLSLLGLLAACGGGGGEPAGIAPAPGVTGTPGAATFPVILEHDTRVVAAADGSDIREEPVPYQPRASAGEGEASPDGRLRPTFRDGTLYVQQGDSEPKAIAEFASSAELADAAWSPDGSRLVANGSFDGSPVSLYVLSVDGLVDIGRGLEGDAFQPVWSPDGQRVAFGVRSAPSPEATHRMYVAGANGTETAPLGEYSGYHGWEGGSDLPTWSPDGARIGVFSPEHDMRVFDASGGPAIDIRGSQGVLRFSWSPDGRFLAFDNGAQDNVVKIADVTQPGEPRQLTEGSWPRWSPDGERIAFKHGGEVFTIRPDGSGLAPLGNLGSNDRGELTWAEDGAELEFVRGVSAVEYVYAVNLRTGEAMRSPTSLTESGFPGVGSFIELAPDGTRVAFPVQSGKEDQYTPGWLLLDLETGDVTQPTDDARGGDIFWTDEAFRLAFSAGTGGVFVAESDRSPPRQVSALEAYTLAWSPDGTRLALTGPDGVRVLAADGSDERTLVSGLDPQAESVQQRIEWAPDGGALLYEVSRSTGGGLSTGETFIVGIDGGPPRILLRSEGEPPRASWSPDGRTMVFTRTHREAGAELRLIDADGGNERLLARFEGQSLTLGTATGTGPAGWSPDGTKIAAVLNGTDVYVVDVATGEATFVAANASYCLMAFLGWSPDSETIYVIPQCALGGI
jgi:Tol biopolymer transport system component